MPYKDPAKAKENRHQRYLKNREKEKKQHQVWLEKHPDYMVVWRRKNRDKISIYNKKRIEEYKAAGGCSKCSAPLQDDDNYKQCINCRLHLHKPRGMEELNSAINQMESQE